MNSTMDHLLKLGNELASKEMGGTCRMQHDICFPVELKSGEEGYRPVYRVRYDAEGRTCCFVINADLDEKNLIRVFTETSHKAIEKVKRDIEIQKEIEEFKRKEKSGE